MYKVFKITWAGLHEHVATFTHEHEAKEFINEHKDFALVIKRAF